MLITTAEFVFDRAPFQECHASTIEETRSGLVAAWLGGTHEGAADVGIWVSRQLSGKWSPPIEVATGTDSAGKPLPCWNPVLFQPRKGPLMLFYKVGPDPRHWWGMLMTSTDAGVHWSKPIKLPDGILGPIKNRPIQLLSGDILCPSSAEDRGWQVHFERTSDLGKTWTKTEPVNDGKAIEAIQPSFLRLANGRLEAIGRTRQDRLFEIESADDGRTWGLMRLGELPNPNSGTDALTLKDGRHLIVFNNVPGIPGQWGGKRSPLNVAISEDGHHWKVVLTLESEPGQEFSYPSVIQARNGLVHIVYTWKRKCIKHVVLKV
ncbi:MAG TPA: sialidase family protein [Fimbriimonadaceae bacterium]|nr:sialidase family protein [Fimbriimonadaceae bacterium]